MMGMRPKHRAGREASLTNTQKYENLTHKGQRPRMRTNIEIDDRLMREALRSSGARTKRATVEAGLRLLVQVCRQDGIRRLRGKVRWEGDLNESRRGRNEE
jgi:Arc/MetJ family transcription regulator